MMTILITVLYAINFAILICPVPENGLTNFRKASKRMVSAMNKSDATKIKTQILCVKLSREPIARSKRMPSKAAEPSCFASMQDTVQLIVPIRKPSSTPTNKEYYFIDCQFILNFAQRKKVLT